MIEPFNKADLAAGCRPAPPLAALGPCGGNIILMKHFNYIQSDFCEKLIIMKYFNRVNISSLACLSGQSKRRMLSMLLFYLPAFRYSQIY
ncbi:MAG: hypothetical protein V4462_06035 [Pseudomonadota bacterium]